MFQYFLLAAFIPAVVFGQSTPVNSCSGEAFPSNVHIVGCAAPPCDLVRGSNAEMYLTFTAESAITTLAPRVRATVLGLVVPYDLPAEQQAACNNLQGSSCPIDAGEEVTWQLLMPITEIYPTISLNIEIALMDQANNVVSCFNVDCQVVAN